MFKGVCLASMLFCLLLAVLAVSGSSGLPFGLWLGCRFWLACVACGLVAVAMLGGLDCPRLIACRLACVRSSGLRCLLSLAVVRVACVGRPEGFFGLSGGCSSLVGCWPVVACLLALRLAEAACCSCLTL